MARGLSPVAKVAIGLTAAYVLFILCSVPGQAPKMARKARNSPARRTLQKPFFQKTVWYENWKYFLPELMAEQGPHYILFVSGTMDGTANGMPWCGDCFACSPIVREMVERVGGSLLEVQAGTKDDWHRPEHPLRVDPEAPIKYIPTLYHWTPNGPGARISAQLNAQTPSLEIKKLVAQFIQDTAGKSHTVVSAAQKLVEAKGKKCHHC